jgi:acetolactate synthase-1/2/3 large subunit
MGKGVIDSRDPAYMGTASLSANDYCHEMFAHSDLIIMVGHDVVRTLHLRFTFLSN